MLIRATFYPTLATNRLMCALGMWNLWDAVDDHVIVGGLPSRSNLRQLAEHGVGAIINCCEEHTHDAGVLADLGFEHLHLPTLDYHSLTSEHVRQGIEFIQHQIQNERKVYVHCKAGRGRSATLALCYLMETHDLPVAAAFDLLSSARAHIDRNIRRKSVVLEFDKRITGQSGS